MATSLCRSLRSSRQPGTLARLHPLQTAVLKTSTEAAQPFAAAAPAPHLEHASALGSAGIDFDDAQAVFAGKPTGRLLQSLAVLRACQFKPLVSNAQALLDLSTAALGRTLTSKLVEATFFGHFCAGTDARTIQPTLAYLRSHGMQPILNYAAEDDVSPCPPGGDAVAAAEAALERQAGVFARSIADCDNSREARGFVGVKLTGLGRPEVLESMSRVLAAEGAPTDQGHASARLAQLMAARLAPAELAGFRSLLRRLTALAEAVHQKGNMRLLVDAEQSYLQPAIDALTIAMQQRFNREEAVVMNTYQCYLTDSAARVEADLARAGAEGWVWGAKAVRGAYLHLERARAAELGAACPVHASLAATHANYDACVEAAMQRVAGGRAELMVASHNQASVEAALAGMRRLGLAPHRPRSGLYFGQLLGMADHLSFPLGRHGYNIFKICAYGSVRETTAYLLRRALENSDMLGGAAREVTLTRAELRRRLSPLPGPPAPAWQPAPAAA